MSRIGKAPIAIPAGVTVEVKDHVVTVKGKNGSLEQVVNPDINVTVEDGQLAGGFGSAVLEWLSDNGKTTRVRRIGLPDRFIEHGTVNELRHIAGTDIESIKQAINDN